MTGHLAAETSAITAFGSEQAAMAAQVAGAAAVDQGALIAAAVPIFGLIGQDFLAAFAYAQGNHIAAVSEIAAVYTGTAVTAFGSAGEYKSMDDGNASSFPQVI